MPDFLPMMVDVVDVVDVVQWYGSKYTVRHARLYAKCVYKRLYASIVRGWVSLLQVKKLQLECKYKPKGGIIVALTSQQMDFVKYYCETMNGKESALRAGYKASNATDTARKLLSRDDIQKAIQEQSKQALANNGIDNDKLIKELKAIAESNITDFVNIVKEIEEFEDYDEDGNAVVRKYETAELEYNETKKLSETQQKCIQSITKTKNGISVSLYDKTKAIDMLCRLGGMYDTEDDNKSITVKIEGNAEDYAN